MQDVYELPLFTMHFVPDLFLLFLFFEFIIYVKSSIVISVWNISVIGLSLSSYLVCFKKLHADRLLFSITPDVELTKIVGKYRSYKELDP